MYWLVTTAPPVASALMIWIIRVLKLSTRLTPDTAASPTEDTIKVSARPMVTLSACSAISGSSSATSACRGNRGVDVNLDDFMLSSVANDKKSSNTPIIQRKLSKCKRLYTRKCQKATARRVSCPLPMGAVVLK